MIVAAICYHDIDSSWKLRPQAQWGNPPDIHLSPSGHMYTVYGARQIGLHTQGSMPNQDTRPEGEGVSLHHLICAA